MRLIGDLSRMNAIRYPDKAALIMEGVELSYADLDRRSNALAHALRDSGVKPGDRVGYLGPLGIGFTPKPAKTWVFVAGGVGIVPFYIFARQARERGLSPRMILLFGGRTDACGCSRPPVRRSSSRTRAPAWGPFIACRVRGVKVGLSD